MAARFVPVPNLEDVVITLPGVQDELTERTQRISDTTMVTSAMAQRHRGRYGWVQVIALGIARRAAATGSLAHLDEWGSANNSPRATMRRAAEREGRFEPEGSQ